MSKIPIILTEDDCKRLFDTLQDHLSWKWDNRFETALAHFSIRERDDVKKILESHLGMAWDNSNIDTSPVMVNTILDTLGGLMPGQLFYAAGLQQDDIIFCAWWPWGNGQTISIRIGMSLDISTLMSILVPLEDR